MQASSSRLQKVDDSLVNDSWRMLSVVVPTYNEESNIEPLYQELKPVLDNIGLGYEVIFIDDGSQDLTYEILTEMVQKETRIRVVRLARNYGQTAALAAGFKHARGDIVVTMDADLQNDPMDIPKFLPKVREGYDVVCGWRRRRQDPVLTKKVPSKISNWLARKIFRLNIHDFGCTLRAYRRRVIEDLEIYGEMHRYLPALAKIQGYSIAEIEVNHRPRATGRSKYKLLRIFAGISDLVNISFIERFGTRPGHLFSSLGILITFVGFLGLILLALLRWIFGHNFSDLLFLFFAAAILTGIQSVTFGMISELMARVRYDLEGRQFYKIREIIERPASS